MGHIDLHLHSTCSDGTLSPEELVDAAKYSGLSTISLTDHDTIAGVEYAMKHGDENGVTVIPGIELSVSFLGHLDIHLLGYWIDISNPLLLDQLAKFAERRKSRSLEMVNAINVKLAEEGRQPVDSKDVTNIADGVVGRPHIGRILISSGYASNMEEAFKRYLIPCNVPKHYWPMEDAIAQIKSSGGVSVLAHPTTITQDMDKLADIISRLAEMGMDGIEAYNARNSEYKASIFQRLANRYRLLVTGGSDFHGLSPDERIGKGRGGIRFPDTMLPPLATRASKS